MMTVIRKSQVSGNLYHMKMDVTPQQMARFERGEDLIQNIFPQLSADEREFIKTGITSEEWEKVFTD